MAKKWAPHELRAGPVGQYRNVGQHESPADKATLNRWRASGAEREGSQVRPFVVAPSTLREKPAGFPRGGNLGDLAGGWRSSCCCSVSTSRPPEEAAAETAEEGEVIYIVAMDHVRGITSSSPSVHGGDAVSYSSSVVHNYPLLSALIAFALAQLAKFFITWYTAAILFLLVQFRRCWIRFSFFFLISGIVLFQISSTIFFSSRLPASVFLPFLHTCPTRVLSSHLPFYYCLRSLKLKFSVYIKLAANCFPEVITSR